ncbi:uncharacterized protein LOC142224582 [Haematobia irritans]|uniref:uncharacterized protein LOC142224582 n=1 Tax=Haematobia irritans TaxID=7368 RepID=UPI003F5036A6
MADPVLLRKFKKFAALFLEFEREYNAMCSAAHTMYTVELRKEEFISLWNKVKTSYEKFNVDCECAEEQEKEAFDLFRQLKDKADISRWADLDRILTARFQSLETVFDFSQVNEPSSQRKLRTYQTSSNKISCFACFQDHFLKNCNKFLRMSQEDRFAVIKKNNLCINCFSNRHRESQTSLSSSITVGGDCPATGQDNSQESSHREQDIQNCFATSSRHVLLGTAVVNIRVKGPVQCEGFVGSWVASIVYLRKASEASRVTDYKGRDESIKIEICGLVLPHLTGRLSSSSISLPERFSVGDIRLADTYFAKSDQVDILIGADVYPQVILDGIQRNVLGSLVAQNTIFGWVLTGQLDSEGSGLTTTVSFCTEVSLSLQLEKFWKLEEPPMVSVMTEEETYCEDLFKPLHAEGKGFGISRTKAFRQFLRNESSLLQKDMYDTAMKEHETLGQMIRLAESSEGGLDFYLPHHAMVKPERTSTKLRVVFNAFCPTSSGLSLNDTLYPGPVLLNDLTLLIIRRRLGRIAEVFPGADGKVRVVEIRTSKGPLL